MTDISKTIHQFEVKNIRGEKVNLSEYKDKVLLIVNTASKCGFTPQLKTLEELYQTYKDQGFEILAFPSNNFGQQEPLEGAAIEEFCSLEFRTTFPIFDKVDVKGKNASELYQFLSDKKKNGAVNSTPKWNFHKYLVDKEGKVIDYYYSMTSPTSTKMKKAIEKLL